MSKPPLYRELLTFAVLGLAMWGWFSVVVQYGPTPLLVVGSITMPTLVLLVIWGQRLDYVNIGDGWITLGMNDAKRQAHPPEDEVEDWRKENR